MNRNIFFLSVLVVSIWIVTHTVSDSSTCLAVNKEGFAPAVFRSPGKLPTHDRRCQLATRQGRRNYMEDRTFCSLDIRIPFPDRSGSRDTQVAIVAVFDGHNGAEASEMASKLLLEKFTNHIYFLLDTTFSSLFNISKGMLLDHKDENLEEPVLHIGRNKFTLSTIFDRSIHLEILKESLLTAIDDIDAEFSKEASRYNLNSGSTAAVILIADNQILVANIGDSKAFLCSQTFLSPSEAKATLMRLYRKKREEGALVHIKDYKLAAESNGLTYLSAKELTMDHHPDRVDERARVESSGGHVLEWAGVSRVNGQLAVSRAIGDVSYKRFGVISVPEVTNWQTLTGNDSYLVAASDGVFEKQSPQDVCDLLRESDNNSLCSYSLADCIVDTAIERGSMDNVAAVVVPIGLETLPSNRFNELDEPIWMKEYGNLNSSCADQI